MKKMLSLMLSAVMLLLSFQITIFAEENDNLLTDAGFESGTLSDANSWKFTGGTNELPNETVSVIQSISPVFETGTRKSGKYQICTRGKRHL